MVNRYPAFSAREETKVTVTDDGRLTYGCYPKARCGDTQNAWQKGCRHPGAIRAHNEWKERKRAERENAVNWPEGQCLAASHDTLFAAEINGCRCPEALERVEEKRGRMAEIGRKRREREFAEEYHREIQRIRRATGGRLDCDPRREWRYGKAGVSSITVMMMLHGFPDNPTRAERMVAIIRLDQQRVRDELTARMRPMTKTEIGRRVGVTEATVRRLRGERERRRDERHLRRLADATWRAAHHAQGEARQRDSGRSAAEHAAKEARRLFYARTRRRLERSRARARYHGG